MNFQQTITNLQLLDAITKRDLRRVQELFKNDAADLNYKNPQDKNNTPLHYAATTNSPEIIQFLLDNNADPGAINSDGQLYTDCLPMPTTSNAVPAVATYFKRPGTASILGQLYESKLLSLVLFRATHWEDRIGPFFLATNVDDAGAFDDLVIRYTDAAVAGGIDRFDFLQLCYEKLSQLSIGQEDQKKLNKIKPEITKILKSEKFNFLKMSDEDSIKLAREFFDKLRFHTQQSTEAEVEQLIQQEIPTFYPVSGDVNLIFQLYHLAVQQWWLQTGHVPFQTKSSALFRDAKTTIERGSLLENLHLISMGKLQVYKSELPCAEKLSDALQSEVQRFLRDDHAHMLPLVGGLIQGGCAQLVEYLRSKNDQHVNFKFINTDADGNNFSGKISPEGAVNDFLVYAHTGQIGQTVIDNLSKNFRKIILVSDKQLPPQAEAGGSRALAEYVPEQQQQQQQQYGGENPNPVEDNDPNSYRNQRKAFLRESRKNIRSLLVTMGGQLINLNVNNKK